MNGLQIFSNQEFGKVRAIEENGKILFCGSDIAKALGYANAPDALNRHCRAIVKRDTPIGGKLQSINFIPEGDVYRLISHSKLPKAEEFERWVFDEVLPTIRKTGGYVASEDTFLETYMPYATEETKALFKTQLQHIRQLNQKIKADAPKALFADAVSASQTSILVGDLAKLLKQNGVNIGSRRLFEWLRQNGYLMRKGEARNMPTQRSMEAGLFEVKETTITNGDGSIRITKTTKVTEKGQQFFVNKFLRERAG